MTICQAPECGDQVHAMKGLQSSPEDFGRGQGLGSLTCIAAGAHTIGAVRSQSECAEGLRQRTLNKRTTRGNPDPHSAELARSLSAQLLSLCQGASDVESLLLHNLKSIVGCLLETCDESCRDCWEACNAIGSERDSGWCDLTLKYF
jgi:hypothetical protein